ncbi:M23 family metallopeptidase [Sphingomonas sp. ASV193]|uniref:M23 family metallopeptidase n=1 Tax=Sphingomonas sp. ASV193 TaxID=3144405 RepID=UPI0032E86C5C
MRQRVLGLTLIVAGASVAAAMVARAPVVPAASASAAKAKPTAAMLVPSRLVASANTAPNIDEAGIVRFSGKVGDDLSAALDRAGVPTGLARQYVRLLAGRIDMQLTVDDRFDLVVDEESGELLFAGLDRVARSDVMLMKWTDGRHSQWLDGDGEGQDAAGLKLPIAGRITSAFGGRMHPILGTVRFHKGVDIAAAYGSPIAAALDGRVVSAGWHGGYGNQVVIAHANGTETRYGHMSRIAARVGEQVRRGATIGFVGSTGLSTGPHLHFEVLRAGRPVNPMGVRLEQQTALAGDGLHRFHDRLRELLRLPG